MYFGCDGGMKFGSNSTAGEDLAENLYYENMFGDHLDKDLEADILQCLKDIKPEVDVITYEDWEDLILKKNTKRKEKKSIIIIN